MIWVKRQKRNCASPPWSNQVLAFSECTCRLHKRASQTLASRKFNVLIDLFVGQVYLRAFGNDQRELHSSGVGALPLLQDVLNTGENEFAYGMALSRRLLF